MNLLKVKYMDEIITQEQEIISYLTFKLGNEYFALNVGKVINILEKQRITKVPKSPNYVTGIINLRGEVLPVIDTNIKIGFDKTETTEKTCILVIETHESDNKIRFGALVDSVQEVLDFEKAIILPSLSIGKNFNTELITGVVKQDDKFIMIIDINKLLEANEATNLAIISKNKVLKNNTNEKK